MTGAEWGLALQRARARLDDSEHVTGAAVAGDMEAAVCAISGQCAPRDTHELERKQGAKPYILLAQNQLSFPLWIKCINAITSQHLTLSCLCGREAVHPGRRAGG